MILIIWLQQDGGGDVEDEAVLDCDNNATGDDEQGDMWMTSA